VASRVELFTVTIAANTAIAAFTTTATRFDPGEVEGIEILVPPGPSGLVGFGIMHGNGSVFPREDSKWIIADNEVLKWPVQDGPTAGAWAVRAYNLDVFAHSLYFRYLVHEVAGLSVPVAQSAVIEQPNQSAPATEEPATA